MAYSEYIENRERAGHPDCWRGRYRGLDGRLKSAGWATTKKKARKLGEDQEAKIRGNAWVDPMAGKITLADYAEKLWFPNRMGERNTLKTYRSHYDSAIEEQLGQLPLNKILPSVIQGWVKAQADAGMVKPNTINARFKVLQMILAAKRGGSALTDGFIASNPCAAVQRVEPLEREIDIFLPPELVRLRAALDPWWIPQVVLAYDLGLRWGELQGLRVSDFTLGYREVHVRRCIIEDTKEKTGNGTRFAWKMYPKGRKWRHLSVTPTVATMIEHMVAERRLGPEDRLFSMPDTTVPPQWHPPLTLEWTPSRTEVWPEGEPVSRAYHRDGVWLKALAAAGLEHRRFHDLRSTNISYLMAKTQNITMVMERVGHTEFSTTKAYAKVLRPANTEAVTAMEAVWADYGETITG